MKSWDKQRMFDPGISALVILYLLISCPETSRDEKIVKMQVNIKPSTTKINWLIIFLVLDTNDLIEYLEELFADLKNTKLRKTTKVYLLIDSVQRMNDPSKFFPFSLKVSEFIYDELTVMVIGSYFSVSKFSYLIKTNRPSTWYLKW